MAPVLTTVSPLSGPPGAAITLTGSGFTAASQVGCPSLVATTYVSATELTASIPPDIEGPSGGSLQVAVFVSNADGTTSTVQMFTVYFPADLLQAYATLDAVVGEVPGFARGGQISDDTINGWIRSASQAVNGTLLRRGFSLDPTTWAQADGTATPDPADILARIVRLGSATKLAAAVASLWGTGDWAITRSLNSDYQSEWKMLQRGDYDHLFAQTGPATEETGQLFDGFVKERHNGKVATFFKKGREF
jgi:hypothetical protein